MKLSELPGRLESAYILLSLLLVTQALEPLILFGSSSDDALTDSNPATLFSALAVYAVAFVFLVRMPHRALHTIVSNPLLVLIFALPLLSMFWSEQPGVTVRRAIGLAMTGIFCVYIAMRLSPDEFLRRLLLALFIGGVASLIYTAAFPNGAIEHSLVNNGSWKGVYGHKAVLGRIAAITVMVSIYVKARYPWEHLMRWATIVIFLFLSIQSQSRASWLMLGAGLGCILVLAALRNKRLSSGLKVAIAASLGLLIAMAATYSFNYVLTDFGRDETFSGRTSLWEGAVAVATDKHPILGAGYRAFWTETGAAGVRDYIQNWTRLPSHGHNGYLDVWLELGIPGVLLFATFLIVTAIRLARRLLREPKEPSWAALSIFLFLFILNNASVTVAFKHTDIAWVFAVLASLYAHGAVTARQPVMGYVREPRLRTYRAPAFAYTPQTS